MHDDGQPVPHLADQVFAKLQQEAGPASTPTGMSLLRKETLTLCAGTLDEKIVDVYTKYPVASSPSTLTHF